jgi:transcriptional regulator with XRE-family HTH domain
MATEQIGGADKLPGPHVVDVHVGGRVRERRILHGLSQERLGAAVGVTFQQVQKYESGANRISASRLFEISHALDVPVSFFFGEMPETAAASGNSGYLIEVFPEQRDGAIDPLLNSKPTLDLVRAYYRIEGGAMRKSILDLIKSMAPAEG